MLTTYNDRYTADINPPTMRQKITREALYFRLFSTDGLTDEDAQRDAIRRNLNTFAVAAGLPEGITLTGEDVENFLDVGCYVLSIEGAAFTPLAANFDIPQMGAAFGDFLELEQGFVGRMLQVIRLQRRPSSAITAPVPGELSDDEKKDESSGNETSLTAAGTTSNQVT